MQVRQLTIGNFRGVQSGTVNFNGDALLVGGNSVGKSTVCEALDLVLGPERMFRRPVVDEWDFWGAQYRPTDDDHLREIRIDVVITDLHEVAQRRFGGHLRRWDREHRSFVPAAEDGSSQDEGEWCLPVGFRARFNPNEDDFDAGTFFLHPQRPADVSADGGEQFGAELKAFSREDKRACGFLYLRALRTGSRALSFERGSLIDTILRTNSDSSQGLFGNIVDDFDNTVLTESNPALTAVQDDLRERVAQFLALGPTTGHPVDVKASELTREHVRSVLRMFLAVAPSAHLVPFTRLSTGTLNILVFSMLTYIAEIAGQDSVIFAMEEPEIALPPHTQRRLIHFATSKMGQTIVTSHSPYVIEQFEPQQIVALGRDTHGALISQWVQFPESFKVKRYRDNRRQFAESLLARGVIVVEGATEAAVIASASETLAEATDFDCEHFDIVGVSIFDAQGDASVPLYAPVFKTLGKAAFGFHDKPKIAFTEEQTANAALFDIHRATEYLGIEELLSTELPLEVLDRFLTTVKDRADNPRPEVDTTTLDEDGRRRHVKQILKTRKGGTDGYAVILLGECQSSAELPATIREFLISVAEHMRQLSVPPDTADQNQPCEATSG